MAGTVATNDSTDDAWSDPHNPGVSSTTNGEQSHISAAMKAQSTSQPLLQPAPPLRAASVQLWLSQIDTGTARATICT
jgi:hypothetical protein